MTDITSTTTECTISTTSSSTEWCHTMDTETDTVPTSFTETITTTITSTEDSGEVMDSREPPEVLVSRTLTQEFFPTEDTETPTTFTTELPEVTTSDHPRDTTTTTPTSEMFMTPQTTAGTVSMSMTITTEHKNS